MAVNIMSNSGISIKQLLDLTGLDLIPYAIGLSTFKSNAPFEPSKLKDIRDKIQILEVDVLEDALKYSKELLDDESSRGEKTESKAYNLLGVTGISAAFITGISSLLPAESPITFNIILVFILTFYLFIVVSLTLTVLLASRVVAVRGYPRPNIADIFKMRSLIDAKLEQLSTYIYCFSQSCQRNNIKVSYLIGAQLWFRNSILIFLVLALLLICNFLTFTSNAQILATEVPSSVPTNTETPHLIPAIGTITSRPLTIQPTSPTGTFMAKPESQTPIATSTATPTATPVRNTMSFQGNP